MTTSITPTLAYYAFPQQPEDRSPQCTLTWRRGQLLVKPAADKVKQLHLPSLESEEWLVECLKHSLVGLVRIDPKVGEAKLRLWADACKQANKPIFLQIPSGSKLLKQDSWLSKCLKRVIDWSVALLLLIGVSPIILGLVLLVGVYSPGPLFSGEWHVGERGQLFRVLKFRTSAATTENPVINYYTEKNDLTKERPTTPLGHWMRKYGLDNLPQLFNVLRGEMTLIGSRPCNLSDAVRLSPEGQSRLNPIPGMIGSLAAEVKTNQLDLDTANRCSF